MVSSHWWKVFIVASLVVITTLGAYQFSKIASAQKPIDDSVATSSRDQSSANADAKEQIEIGGVKRPRTDVAINSTALGLDNVSKQKLLDRETKTVKSEPDDRAKVGAISELVKGKNAQMDSVVEALADGKHPERLSPMVSAAKFNKEQWDVNPRAYLSVVEPGRIYDTLPPGKNVPVLKMISSAYTFAVVGEAIRLQVQTKPNSPVTFTNFLNGFFENGLRSITVVSNTEGIAEAVSTMPIGNLPTKAEIVAASPVASGSVRFVIEAAPKSE